MHTTHANFSNDDIAQAIASAQVAIEHLTYKGKAARKVQHEYTVKGIAADRKTVVIDHYDAYSEGDAMSQFADDYGIRAVEAYRTRIAR